MATTMQPAAKQRWARQPFYFNSAAHLLRIGRQRATNLNELLESLETCPEDSIFQHTFQTLQEHHFIREGFSNDFAHWAFAACNEVGLAERLSSIDVREYTSIKALRDRIVGIVEGYLKKNPRSGDRAALEPFYFCASDTVVIPLPVVARNLQEFIEAIQKVSIHSVHYHFLEARLRLKLNSNDFSMWLEEELDLGALAGKINQIDIYTSTLQDVRRAILRILQPAAMAA
ncbi:MAG: hypothetical protein JO041_14070 [Acidobacteria bacterium]|nr:hypothetical protein [Acidobacteriota bacterium]